ncbi:hypothetical protein [Schaalia sp. ZJ1691]|uniref:maltokinase N-terminal cap-like domain-containing protein n=1 Tax=Schaalia sp. ZJ1691 TaxID=2709404 RepID=UPI0013ECE7D9|nr:hypothetical protein [Schaalia sp. ZJ1691]
MTFPFPTSALFPSLCHWVRQRRWFPGEDDTPISLVDVAQWPLPDEDEHAPSPGTRVFSVVLGAGEALLFVPLVVTGQHPDSETAVIAHIEDQWVVDGPQHPATIRAWAMRARSQATMTDEVYSSLCVAAANARMLTGEQSNSSVLVPTDSGPRLIKFYRVLQPGIHPELEVTLALGRAGWSHVSAPQAYSLATIPGHADSALEVILSPFVTDVDDGFEFFTSLAATDADPREPAYSLGEVIASMHRALAEEFGAHPSASGAEIARRVKIGIAAAAAEVAEITPDIIAGLNARLDKLASFDELPQLIRIHGDLHLGQTLHGDSWHVLDFEGEPMRPLDERRRPDFAARDVAGMLRSFSYAAAQVGVDEHANLHDPHDTAEIPVVSAVGEQSRLVHERSVEWERVAREAFIEGYVAGGHLSEGERLLIEALMVEKAAYETVYEHRFRPGWLRIPLGALREFAGLER